MKNIIGIVMLALLMAVSVSAPAFCQGARVAVFPIKNNGQAQYGSLAGGLASMLAGDIAKSKELDVVDPSLVEKAVEKSRLAGGAPSYEDAMKAAAELSADFAVMGEFVVFGGKFRIDVRVYDVKAGQLKSAQKAQAKEDSFFDMVDELSGKVMVSLTGSLPAAGGALRVESDPPGASLLVDGEKAGVTPITIKDAATGPHKVELELDGYKPFTQTATVREGETEKVDAKLIRLFGGIRLFWQDYPDSDVSIGGLTVGMSNFQYNPKSKYCKNLPAGDYTVTARMARKEESSWDPARTWRTYTAGIEVAPGEVVDIFVNNNLHSPGIVVSACGSCVSNWDFDTDIVWFESR